MSECDSLYSSIVPNLFFSFRPYSMHVTHSWIRWRSEQSEPNKNNNTTHILIAQLHSNELHIDINAYICMYERALAWRVVYIYIYVNVYKACMACIGRGLHSFRSIDIHRILCCVQSIWTFKKAYHIHIKCRFSFIQVTVFGWETTTAHVLIGWLAGCSSQLY